MEAFKYQKLKRFNFEVKSMHKKVVRIAVQKLLKDMARQPYTSQGSGVWNVAELLCGRSNPTGFSVNSIGFGYGYVKAIQLGSSVSYLATVHVPLPESRIIGWNKFLRMTKTILESNIWFTMPPISIRMAV